MWKFLQADFKYNVVKLIGTVSVFILFVITGIYFYANTGISLDFLQGFFAGFFFVVLFIPQLIHSQEKRIRLYGVLPVKPKQIAAERIITTIIELIAIVFLLLIVGFFTTDIVIERFYVMLGIFLILISGFLFLRDKWFSYFEKKKRIITVVSYLISFLLPTSLIIWYAGGSIKNISLQKGYLLSLVLLLIGSAILMLTINSFRKRKSYLN